MPLPLIPLAVGLAANLARGVGTNWARALLAREGTGLLAKSAPRLSGKMIAGGAAMEVAEDAAGVNLPEVIPSTIVGAKAYRATKDILANKGLASYFSNTE